MVHEAAAGGYQKASEAYASARPTYHPLVVDAIAAGIDRSLGAGLVIDLGAGTGISTAALLERGLQVLAVEPVEAMRTTLRAQLRGVQAVEGTAEAIPVDDGVAAAVVVAQAFHWFDHGPALDEIARVLAPAGRLITLWNVRDESVPWMAAYTATQDEVQGDTPRYRSMVWRAAIDNDARFELIDEVAVANPQPSDSDRVESRFLSTSFVAKLDPQAQQELAHRIRVIVSDLGDEFDFPYTTEAQVWSLRPTAGTGSSV